MSMRLILILSSLLIFSACAEEPRHYDYDLSALAPWQREIFIQKAEKWNSIVGYQLFSFGGSTDMVYFADLTPFNALAIFDKGNIVFTNTVNWISCNNNNGGIKFDGIAAHEQGHAAGYSHSLNWDNIMHDPPPYCSF